MGDGEREDADALEAMRAEAAHWQGEAALADARAAEAFAEGEALREQLRGAAEASTLAAAQAQEWQAQLESAQERERTGAAQYRELVLQAEPGMAARPRRRRQHRCGRSSRGAAAREIVGSGADADRAAVAGGARCLLARRFDLVLDVRFDDARTEDPLRPQPSACDGEKGTGQGKARGISARRRGWH